MAGLLQPSSPTVFLYTMLTWPSDARRRDGLVQLDATPSPLLVALLAVASTVLVYLLFVPPSRLRANKNGVPVIRSRFGGLGAIGFYANRYRLCVSIKGGVAGETDGMLTACFSPKQPKPCSDQRSRSSASGDRQV